MLLRQPNTFFCLLVLQFTTIISTIIYDYHFSLLLVASVLLSFLFTIMENQMGNTMNMKSKFGLHWVYTMDTKPWGSNHIHIYIYICDTLVYCIIVDYIIVSILEYKNQGYLASSFPNPKRTLHP